MRLCVVTQCARLVFANATELLYGYTLQAALHFAFFLHTARLCGLQAKTTTPAEGRRIGIRRQS